MPRWVVCPLNVGNLAQECLSFYICLFAFLWCHSLFLYTHISYKLEFSMYTSCYLYTNSSQLLPVKSYLLISLASSEGLGPIISTLYFIDIISSHCKEAVKRHFTFSSYRFWVLKILSKTSRESTKSSESYLFSVSGRVAFPWL